MGHSRFQAIALSLLMPLLIGMAGCTIFSHEKQPLQQKGFVQKTFRSLLPESRDHDANALASVKQQHEPKHVAKQSTAASEERKENLLSQVAQNAPEAPLTPPLLNEDAESSSETQNAGTAHKKDKHVSARVDGNASQPQDSEALKEFLSELADLQDVDAKTKQGMIDGLRAMEQTGNTEFFNTMLFGFRRQYFPKDASGENTAEPEMEEVIAAAPKTPSRPEKKAEKMEIASTNSNLKASKAEVPSRSETSDSREEATRPETILSQNQKTEYKAPLPQSLGPDIPQGRFPQMAVQHPHAPTAGMYPNMGLNPIAQVGYAQQEIPGQISIVHPSYTVPAAGVQNMPPGVPYQGIQQGSATAQGEWEQLVRYGVEKLRTRIASWPVGKADPHEEAKLRLLELALGNHREASRPIMSFDVATRNLWASEMLGLGVLLDDLSHQEPAVKHTSAAHHFKDGLRELQTLCPLKVRNMQFVSDYFGFGVYKPIANELTPGQETTIYFELENITIRESSQGFNVKTSSTYEIRDADANVIAREEKITAESTSRSRCRDNCVAIQFQIPRTADPGRYFLKIIVNDQNHDMLQSAEDQIPFRIRAYQGE